MKTLLAALILTTLCGCTSLQPIATSKETFVTCRAVDVATTLAIVHSGGHELNPLMAPLVAHPVLFIAFNLAIAWYVWHSHITPTEQLALNTVSCVGPIHNTAVLLGH